MWAATTSCSPWQAAGPPAARAVRQAAPQLPVVGRPLRRTPPRRLATAPESGDDGDQCGQLLGSGVALDHAQEGALRLSTRVLFVLCGVRRLRFVCAHLLTSPWA